MARAGDDNELPVRRQGELLPRPRELCRQIVVPLDEQRRDAELPPRERRRLGRRLRRSSRPEGDRLATWSCSPAIAGLRAFSSADEIEDRLRDLLRETLGACSVEMNRICE